MFYPVFKNPKNGLLYSDGVEGDAESKFVNYYEMRYGSMAMVYKRQNKKEYLETIGYILNKDGL